MRHHGRRKVCALISAVIGSVLVLASCASGGSRTDVQQNASGAATVKVGLAVPTFNTALIHLAMAADLDAKHGLDMQPTHSGTGSNNQLAAMMAGEYDFAAVGTLTAVNAVSEGAPLSVVAGTGSLINNLVLSAQTAKGLGVSPDAPVQQRLKALKGLTIVTSPPGGTSNSTLKLLLRDAGLDPEKDVKILSVSDSSAIVSGLRTGRFDASFFGVGVADVNIADGSGVLWLSIPRGDLPRFDDLVGVCIISTRQFVEAQPEVVKKFHATLADAVTYVEQQPEQAGKILQKEVFDKLAPDVFSVAWDQAKTGFPQGAYLTKKNWQTFKEMYQPYSKKDFDSIAYDELVAQPAMGQA